MRIKPLIVIILVVFVLACILNVNAANCADVTVPPDEPYENCVDEAQYVLGYGYHWFSLTTTATVTYWCSGGVVHSGYTNIHSVYAAGRCS